MKNTYESDMVTTKLQPHLILWSAKEPSNFLLLNWKLGTRNKLGLGLASVKTSLDRSRVWRTDLTFPTSRSRFWVPARWRWPRWAEPAARSWRVRCSSGLGSRRRSRGPGSCPAGCPDRRTASRWCRVFPDIGLQGNGIRSGDFWTVAIWPEENV